MFGKFGAKPVRNGKCGALNLLTRLTAKFCSSSFPFDWSRARTIVGGGSAKIKVYHKRQGFDFCCVIGPCPVPGNGSRATAGNG